MGYDSLDDLIAILSLALEEMRNGVGPPEDLSVLVGEYAEVSLQDEFGGRPFALAPVRSKPKRTYDPEEARPDSEGRHVPFALANVRGTRGRSKWEKLRKKIEPFGRESGLFDGVTVKRLGKSVNDPFQIQVNIQGLSRNLIDVGYGVSQVLPLLFEALSPDSPRTLLIQQPEVHLHPKAQAELATFMTALSKTTGNRFVVETHSDYFVNRMRTLIREKKTSVDDVAILYFERRKHDVKIHRLQIDELGNLIKPPRSYRQFFIKEAGRFLGVK
jgi:hypothetical protein